MICAIGAGLGIAALVVDWIGSAPRRFGPEVCTERCDSVQNSAQWLSLTPQGTQQNLMLYSR